MKTVNKETLNREINRRMRIISQGAAQIIGEEDLRAKLERSLLTDTPLTVKLGLDPSAPDIHLGHAVVLRKLKQMQDMGHRIVIIIGDFTGRIGDPTGKSKGRKALSDREILQNAQTYQEQVFQVLDSEKTTVRYNGEWLELLKIDEILRLPPLPWRVCWSGTISRTATDTTLLSGSMNFFTLSCRLMIRLPSRPILKSAALTRPSIF